MSFRYTLRSSSWVPGFTNTYNQILSKTEFVDILTAIRLGLIFELFGNFIIFGEEYRGGSHNTHFKKKLELLIKVFTSGNSTRTFSTMLFRTYPKYVKWTKYGKNIYYKISSRFNHLWSCISYKFLLGTVFDQVRRKWSRIH